MKKGCAGILVLFLIISTAWADSGMNMKEGRWEMAIETEIEGMPMKMPPMTYRQCVSKDTPVPQNEKQNQQCRVTDMKTAGDTVSWAVKCDTPGGAMTGTGKVTYRKDKMSGQMAMQTQGMKMIYHMNGHYIGPCDK